MSFCYLVGVLCLNIFGYKFLNRQNFSLTTVKKLILSMCFGSIGMLMTGGIEILRQQGCNEHDVSKLSAFIQVAPRIVMSISQLFGLLAILQFTCFIAPRSARSIFFSLYFFSRIIANYSVSALTNILTKHQVLNFKVKQLLTFFSFSFILIF